MAESVGQIGLDLVVNQSGFNRQMSGIQSLARKAGAALAGAFAVKKLVDFGRSCTQLGSDLAEVQNVVDVTFPHMTAQIDKFAKSAIKDFGLSETMAKQYTGTFGAMAKSFGFGESAVYDMSAALTGLSGDVASFYNISQDEAFTKLKSVFTGETETLKDLGVVMTQSALDAYALAHGYGKATQAMSEAEKVALRYAFVQDKLSAASGDFARTAGGWANQIRVMKLQFDSLKASIGQGLINLFTPTVKAINVLLGKLATLANAFKSFTELITGNKSSGGVSGFGKDAAAGLADAADSADSLKENTSGIGSAAKKAAKEMRTLMGFDQINKLGTSSEEGGSGQAAGDSVDYGSLAESDTVLDKTDSRLNGLISKVKELAGIFKDGFTAGLGKDFEASLARQNEHIKGIGKSLKGIFTDAGIVSSADGCAKKIVYALGQISGSAVSIGASISENLLGGIDGYLVNNSGFIKQRIINMLDASGDIATLAGNFWEAFAEVAEVLRSDAAKLCTESIIEIFTNITLTALDLGAQLGRDLLNIIVQPFVENKDEIKLVLEDLLDAASQILSAFSVVVTQTCENIVSVYEGHIKPLLNDVANGISSIASIILDCYNTYLAPVLDYLTEKITVLINEHAGPCLRKAVELIGSVADAVGVLWNNYLKPCVEWFIQTMMPLLAPIIQTIADIAIEMAGCTVDAISGILAIGKGLLDFITAVFTGDWTKAWESIKKVGQGVFDFYKSGVNGLIGVIEALVNGLISGVNTMVRALNKLSFTTPDWLPGIGGKSFGFNLSELSSVSIPRLAQGGYVKANTPQLAMIGDNRHQGEIVAPENKLQEIVDAAVSSVRPGITKEELETVMNQAVVRLIAALSAVGFYLDGEQLATLQRMAQTGIDRRYNTVSVSV